MKGHRSKHGGFVGNLAKLGGAHKKLKLTGDFRTENMVEGTSKKAAKQAHKRV